MIEVHGVRAVVTDIEGTTTSLAFVKDVLFPYARRAIPTFVRDHESQLSDIAREIAKIVGKPTLDVEGMTAVLLGWMDEDRKITPLKDLQGTIWRTGYERGELRSHVYEDAVRGLRRWHADGLQLYVYSSGSIAAQQLLFAHTADGDLRQLFSGYFDTTTGPKLESASYGKIAAALDLPPPSIVFLSDHPGETRAAAEAGLQSVLLDREGTAPAAEAQRDRNAVEEIPRSTYGATWERESREAPAARRGTTVPCARDFDAIALRSVV
jgi:enolase-phosphatase E1